MKPAWCAIWPRQICTARVHGTRPRCDGTFPTQTSVRKFDGADAIARVEDSTQSIRRIDRKLTAAAFMRQSHATIACLRLVDESRRRATRRRLNVGAVRRRNDIPRAAGPHDNGPALMSRRDHRRRLVRPDDGRATDRIRLYVCRAVIGRNHGGATRGVGHDVGRRDSRSDDGGAPRVVGREDVSGCLSRG